MTVYSGYLDFQPSGVGWHHSLLDKKHLAKYNKMKSTRPNTKTRI